MRVVLPVFATKWYIEGCDTSHPSKYNLVTNRVPGILMAQLYLAPATSISTAHHSLNLIARRLLASRSRTLNADELILGVTGLFVFLYSVHDLLLTRFLKTFELTEITKYLIFS